MIKNMVRRCSYKDCKSDERYLTPSQLRRIKFCSFPKPWNPKTLPAAKRWAAAIGREDFTIANVRRWTHICSKHFVGGKGPTPEDPDPIAHYEILKKSRKDRMKRKLPSFVPNYQEPKKNLPQLVRVPVPTTPATCTESSKDLVRVLYTGSHMVAQNDHGSRTVVHTDGLMDIIKLPALKVLGEPPVIYGNPASMENTCTCDEKPTDKTSERLYTKKVELNSTKSSLIPQQTGDTSSIKRLKKEEVYPEMHDYIVTGSKVSTLCYLARAQEENLVLTKKIGEMQKLALGHKKWSVDKIKDNDEKTRMYTGLLSWSAFLNLYSITEHDITEAKCRLPDSDGLEETESMELALSDELFAVLTTLKLGLFREDIADCFAIPVSTFDQIFRIWIACLFSKLPEWSSINLPSLKPPGLVIPSIIQNTVKLKFILCWLKLTLGLDKNIAESGNSERPFKILIALNCQGNIIFSSGIWVQKAAGLMVATNSGILRLIEDGDSIIVPSDIDIGSTVSPRNVKTITLPYDREEEIGNVNEQTQSVYSFIQQCTDRLKVFGIMNRIVPPELLELSHKIVAVCSQLSNIYHS